MEMKSYNAESGWMCNGSPTIEPETCDFRSVLDRSATSIICLSRLCLMSLFFNPHYCHHSFHCYHTNFDGHHSDFGITSLLVHSMHCTSMPHGSSLPFHPTTITPFCYSLTPLVPTPSANSTLCLHSMSWRMGFSYALCLRHRPTPFPSFIFLPFLIGFFVLVVRDVVTLSVVTWSHLLTPKTLDLTMLCVLCLVLAVCFSSFNSLPL